MSTGQESSRTVAIPRRFVRLGLILAVAAAVLGFGVFESQALMRGGSIGEPVARRLHFAAPTVQPLPASKLIRSTVMRFNGSDVVFTHYSCGASPEDVVRYYERTAPRTTATGEPLPAPYITLGTDRAMICYPDKNGSTVGVVAMGVPGRKASNYFVGRTAAAPKLQKNDRTQDVAGKDAPRVPRPLTSRRVFSIEGTGGIPSVLCLYEGWGEVERNVAYMREGLVKDGWTENADVESVVGRELEGSVLSFVRGTSHLFIHCEREQGSNLIATTVMYSEKDWLPANKGF